MKSNCGDFFRPRGKFENVSSADGEKHTLSDALAVPGLDLLIYKSLLPIGAGLGSSAAFCVSISGALIEARRAAQVHSWGKGGDTPVALSVSSSSSSSASSIPASSSANSANSAKTAAAVVAAESTTSITTSIHAESPAPSTPAVSVDVSPFLKCVNEWSFAGEAIFHGSPSGLDNTVSTYGGAIAYQRILPPTATTQGIAAATANSSSAGSNPAPSSSLLQLALPPLSIMVTNTRVPKQTAMLVAGVKAYREALPRIIDPILDAMDAISREFVAAVEKGQCESEAGSGGGGSADAAPAGEEDGFVKLVRKLIPTAHSLLNAIGVGHSALEVVKEVSLKHGYVAKLTGAGGGGCVLTFLGRASTTTAPSHPSETTQLMKDMQAAGFDCFQTTMGGAGVTIVESASSV